jgi:hypothetical protein
MKCMFILLPRLREETLTASPVEVAYQSDILAENAYCIIESPAEDYPITEAEPPAAEEALAKADSEPEAAQQTNGLSECKSR